MLITRADWRYLARKQLFPKFAVISVTFFLIIFVIRFLKKSKFLSTELEKVLVVTLLSLKELDVPMYRYT